MYRSHSVKISFITCYFCFNETFLLIYERIFLFSLGNIQKNINLFPCFAIISYICLHKTKKYDEKIFHFHFNVYGHPVHGM